MMINRQTGLALVMVWLLAGCAASGGERDGAGGVKFQLSAGVVEIVEEEGRIDLATDSRVACVEDQVTGSQRVLRICATSQEWRSGAWRSQLGNLSIVSRLTDLQHHPSAIIQ